MRVQLLLEFQGSPYEPGSATKLPKRRPCTIVVRLSLQGSRRHRFVFIEGEPPVGIDEQRSSPFKVRLVEPEVVV